MTVPERAAAQRSVADRDPSAFGANAEHERWRVVYTVLRVTVGDGFRFGVGFFALQAVVLLVILVLAASILVLVRAAGLVVPFRW